jgi:hypothetical protein
MLSRGRLAASIRALVAPGGNRLKSQTYDIPALRRFAFDPSVLGGPAPPVPETVAVPAVV